MNPKTREVTRIVTAHRQTEGAGFVVRRPLPTAGLTELDPFLLIDEMGPVTYKPGEALGAPHHPHRGFETITYMLDGEFEHEDSAGHKGTIRSGDVQWMTAGGGIIHSEEPSRRIREQGGRLHGFQIWLNLPAKLKMSSPRYQEVPADRIPKVDTADQKSHGRVIAGNALGVSAVINTHTPIMLQDWDVSAGGEITLEVGDKDCALVYAFTGEVQIGDKTVKDGELAILGEGTHIRIVGPKEGSGRVLVLAGPKINEPVVRYGPFVMNTEKEIVQAVEDYQRGRLGKSAT